MTVEVTINDLPLAVSADPDMQFEIDIGGVTVNKLTLAQLALYTATQYPAVYDNSEVTSLNSNTPRTLQDRFFDIVNPKDYGAQGDGVSDDTQAFEDAIATGGVLVPSPGTYVLKDMKILSKTSIIGNSQLTYGETITSNVVFRAGTGATAIIDSGDARGWNITGICFNGVNRSAHGIYPVTGGSDSLGTIANCTIRYCNQAAGGSGSAYSNALTIYNTIIMQNVTGITNFVDSKIQFSTIAANTGNGIYCSAGSNDIILTGNKIEFNEGYGILIYQATNITGSNNIIDRNYKAGIYFSTATYCNFASGNVLRRNGRNNVAGQRSHVAFEGTCSHIIVNDNISRTGEDDGGGGGITPAYFAEYVSGTQSYITMLGNDVTGFVTSEYVGTLPTICNIENVGGVTYSAGQPINKKNGRVFQSAALSGTITANGGTTTFNMTQYPDSSTYTNAFRDLAVSVRDLTTGTDYSAKFNIALQREGGGASMLSSSAFGEVGGSGKITVAGAGTITNLAFSNIATDGSTFDIIVTNNHTNNIQVAVEYK